MDEVTFDLAQLRKAKRLLKRSLKELEAMEKHVLKFRSTFKNPPRPSKAELRKRYTGLAQAIYDRAKDAVQREESNP